ncbi:MAG: 50S ribosomal protein L10 [Candidatus Eremiobacteraeota bacterium]|nr:50S ribosomal protein L10 [Candidatus Eremiobacteraeota bacterium]
MALSHKEAIKKKQHDIEEIKQKIGDAQITILTDYRGDSKGMSVKMITELRNKLREAKGEYKIYKNTLSSIAVKEMKADELADHFKGPTAMIFGYEDPASTSKALVEFLKGQKENPLPTIKAGYMEGEYINEDTIRRLATLPPKPVLLGNLLRVMNGSIQGFVNILNGVPRSFVTVLSEIKDKKEEMGEKVEKVEEKVETVETVETVKETVETGEKVEEKVEKEEG